MTNSRNPSQAVQSGDISDVARSLMRARLTADGESRPLSPVIAFIGAGCSRSAGVPLAQEVAQDLTKRLNVAYRLPETDDPVLAATQLEQHGHFPKGISANPIDWHNIYDLCFQEHYKTPDDARRIFKRIIKEAAPKLNWAHLCLGELFRIGYCSTLITTNFDLLALEGMFSAGQIPVVSDGLESLGRIDGSPEFPQLLQLNGSIHSYRLRNRLDELDSVFNNPTARACFRDLLRNASVIVFVGYGGREEPIMQLLIQTLEEFPDKEIYWTTYDHDTTRLSPYVVKLLSMSANARLIPGQDADLFFYNLLKKLGVGAPEFVSNPLAFLKGRVARLAKPSKGLTAKDIFEELASLDRFIEELSEKADALASSPKKADAERAALDAARGLMLQGKNVEALDILSNAIQSGLKSTNIIDRAAEAATNVALDTSKISDFTRAIELSESSYKRWSVKTHRNERVHGLFRLGALYNRLGTNNLDEKALQLALQNYEKALALIKKSEDERIWAQIKNNIGSTASQLADTVRDEKYLHIAELSYKDCLSVFTKDDDLEGWLITKGNVGNVYLSFGEHRGDIEFAHRAIVEYQESIEFGDKDHFPQIWARAQHNCGNAYAFAASQTNDEMGKLANLNNAKTCYQAALSTRDAAREPVEWSTTALNLAGVYKDIHQINSEISLSDKIRELTQHAELTLHECGIYAYDATISTLLSYISPKGP